ncbi:ADP-ribosylglycohydrolase family protein [Methanofollis fontis]|uniref:ADP-ribosylglycohydrolase family protein n=1 Tax=Methanofollis fontis TaxID=2052832 RepID=UPI001F206750|nr:ADP-ribosylglycohydrolase family protein [Methanofollis fontis]
MHFTRVAGVLLGLAVGDALGAPLEGLPSPDKTVTRMQSGGIHATRRGEYTDDTLQALGLARSLIVCRGFSPEDFISRLISSYEQEPRYYGPTSRTVFSLVREGIRPEDAAKIAHIQNRGSRTNGSVMRAPPVGVFYSPATVREVSLACSALTHHDPVAGECSAFVNQMISELCRGASKMGAFCDALDRCQNAEVAERLGNFHIWPLEPSLDAVLSTHCALAVFMGSDSLEKTLVRAVNLGGDADTVGAIAGALAGALYGFPSIPHRWLVDFRHTGEILSISRRLWAVAEHA